MHFRKNRLFQERLNTWNKSIDSLQGMADYDDIYASSADVVWLVCNGNAKGGGFTARVKITNGKFEANLFTNDPYMMEGVSAINDDVAWAVGQNLPFFISDKAPLSGIFFTKDGGVTWVPQKILVDAHDVQPWKVSFVGTRR
jgi:hypothetical protein